MQDSEIVRTWLCELRMEDCWELFDNAGYDMPTISRMTPEVRFQSMFFGSFHLFIGVPITVRTSWLTLATFTNKLLFSGLLYLWCSMQQTI